MCEVTYIAICVYVYISIVYMCVYTHRNSAVKKYNNWNENFTKEVQEIYAGKDSNKESAHLKIGQLRLYI